MTLQKDNRLAWGISFLVFGFILLARQLDIFPREISDIIFDFKNYPLIIGIIFILTHKNKNIGLILIVVGLFFRLSDIIRWTQHVSDFIWPFLLIIVGAILVFGKGKRKKY